MTDEVLFSVESGLARIRLNRPKPLHALNYAMCDAMIVHLLAWAKDDSIKAVMIDHAEGRGFCAGGDVVMLAKSGAADGAEARAFFFREYQLNHLLFTYEKPIVAFMDGVTMGGGVGISQPCRYHVATERTAYAMPETTIGLFADVGGGHYLSRLPNHLGAYIVLTGTRLKGPDCRAFGLATHYVPSDDLEALKAKIAADPASLGQILDAADQDPGAAALAPHIADIDRLFSGKRYEDILAALQADGSDWAKAQLETLAGKSPQSCKVCLRQLQEAAKLDDFADEMRMEYAMASRVVLTHDFVEGVRALLIDKTNDPKWNPPTPEAVSEQFIDTIFAPLPAAEAWRPLDKD